MKDAQNIMSENILERDVRYFKGVGPKLAQLLYKKGIFTAQDALFFLPKRWEVREEVSILDIKLDFTLGFADDSGEFVKRYVVKGILRRTEEIETPRRKVFKMVLEGEGGKFECVWFNVPEYLKIFGEGDEVAVCGQAVLIDDKVQFVHPKVVLAKDVGKLKPGETLPVYSSDARESSEIHRAIKSILRACARHVVSVVPERVETELGMPSLTEALFTVHMPPEGVPLKEVVRAKERIIFEEIFRVQSALALKRMEVKSSKTIWIDTQNSILDFFINSLPFRLTSAQLRCIEEIKRDMASGKPMYRLLQGDVGSGKTVVAYCAILLAVASGHQAVFMAPTEILAQQVFENFKAWSRGFGISVALLTGATGQSERKNIFQGVESGSINILVGTHALLYHPIRFRSLGLCVIDEQHRFGVLQRLALVMKAGYMPHILVMTATPIPRTMALTAYSDLDISIIDELPEGRKPPETRVFTENQRELVWQEVERELSSGGSVYIVYPLLEDSEKLDLPSAQGMYEQLKGRFERWGVGLLHGRMRPAEKKEVIDNFRKGKIKVLVATTVIEVGVDVPEATLMVVEHAERFGLAQLHQLRGRVGRGERRGRCILVVPEKLGEKALQRVRILEKETDGFKIAQYDLEMRGAGDILGTQQHGQTVKQEFFKNQRLVKLARDWAFRCVLDDFLTVEEKAKFVGRIKDVLSDKKDLVISG